MARTPRLKFDIMANDKTGQAFSALQDKVNRTEQRLALAKRQFLAVGAAAGLVAVALGGVVRSGLQVVDAQAKLAQSLGTTVASIQTLERAGELAGVSMSGIEQATKDLTRRLSQAAAGTGPASDALDRLGLSANELMSMPLDQRVGEINAAIEEFVPAAQRAAVAGQLFGEEGSIAMSRIDTETLRQATEDLRNFGVIVSEQDADQIERTNDALSRLGLVWSGLANQLAIAAAPALETVANLMATIASRSGAVGQAIEAFGNNVGRIMTYLGTAATAFGVRYVAALVAARVATLTLAGSLRVLRGALIRTGIGAIVVAAGELIYQFGRLVSATGSFGGALSLLKDVAVEVFGRIKESFALVPLAVQAGSASMKATFLEALRAMLQGFQDLTWSVAEGLNNLFGLNLSGARIGAISDGPMGGSPIERMRNEAEMEASRASGAMADLAGSLTAPLQSLAALQTTVTDAANEIADSGEAAGQLSEELDGVAGSGSGAGAALDELTEEVERFNDETRRGIDAVSDFFMAIGAGGNAALDVIKRLVLEMAKVQITRGLETLAGASSGVGGFFDFLGGLLTNANGNAFSGGRVIPFADGGVVTGPTLFPMAGRSTGLMGEAGAEAIMPLKRGADGKLGVASSGGGGKSITVHMSIDARGADASIIPRLEQTAQQIMAQVGPMIDARLRNPDIRYGG